MNLNDRAQQLCRRMLDEAERLRIEPHRSTCGALIIDCGVKARGGLEAGCALAEVCLSGLGSVQMAPGNPQLWPGPSVAVATDHPVAACMASQYAGWQVSVEGYFAMGSGPMRAAAGREELFDKIGHRQPSGEVVGVLEAGKLPSDEACRHIAENCGVSPDKVTLLVARTASQAGTLQVSARTVETALHKLLELGFDLSRIDSGFGVCPLPPVAADDMAAIGRTNDAVLYAGETTLWVRGDDASLEEIGPKAPSSASPDYGEPFAAIFERYERNFYKIDPHLFSPAVITMINLETGRVHRFGQTRPDVLASSFGGEG